MMMPHPIYRFIEKVGISLGLDWPNHQRIMRAYILEAEGEA
jgi:hypothetical protein